MGQIRFLVPSALQLPHEAVCRAYLAGIEGIPWRSRNGWSESPAEDAREFVLERTTGESGNLYIPWHTAAGERMLSTASLMERTEPYFLPLELARGTLNRLRNQAADWQFMGLQLPPEFAAEMREIAELFSRAVTCGGDRQQAAELSAQTIERSVAAIEQLVDIYIEQATAARQCNCPTLPTFLSLRVEPGRVRDEAFERVAAAFNSSMIAVNWREIEPVAGEFSWETLDQEFERSRQHGLRIIGGPLLQLDKHHTPEWLNLWEDDFDEIQASVVRFVRAVLERYRGQVHVWNGAARMNLECAIDLKEEQRLRLVVAVIDEIQRLDPRTPYIIAFDQPWAEYLVHADHDFSPLHFADSLVRAELGLAGIGLEMNFGYAPEGSPPRDLLEVSRLLDRWNMLGLPLLVFQALPSGADADSQARVAVSPCLADCQLQPETQANTGERMLRLILAKSFVHGYVWQDATDAQPHEFSHAGLLDPQQQSKPLLQRFVGIRQQYLS